MFEEIVDDGYAIPDERHDEERARELSRSGYAAQLDSLGYTPDGNPKPTALITVTSLPEIQENLRALRERWEQKAKDAAAMVCTADTVQAIKQMRADMRKEYEEADKQRKAAKAMYLAPWNAVEDTFRECVSNAATKADQSFKATIDEYEGELKRRCREDLERYFAEMCVVHGVDFLTFDQAMAIGKLKINLADANAKTPRKLQDGIAEVVARIAVGMDQIRKMDDAAEIMAEYRTCFDVGKAAAAVSERKRKIEAEREAEVARIRRQEAAEAAIQKVAAVATTPTEEKAQETAFSREIENEPIFDEFTFTVFGCTKTQLIKIREYLKQEGIAYE